MVNATASSARGAEVLAAASAALAATSVTLLADKAFYDSSLKVRMLQASGGCYRLQLCTPRLLRATGPALIELNRQGI